MNLIGISTLRLRRSRTIFPGIFLLYCLSFFSLNAQSLTKDALTFQNGLYHHAGAPFTGTITEHHPKGQKSAEYHYRNGLAIGQHRTWSDAGQLLTRFNYNDQGHLHGLQERWHPNGVLAEQSPYDNGWRTGMATFLYDDGSLCFRMTVQDGYFKNEYWYIGGQLGWIKQSRNGQLHGLQQSWRRSGVVMDSVNYEKGKPQGLFRTNNPFGVRTVETSYSDTLIVRRRYGQGMLVREDFFREGLLEEARFWDFNGGLMARQAYKNGLPHGKHLTVNGGGVVMTEAEFREGFLHGVSRLWWPGAGMREEVHYENGRKSGSMKSWHENGNKKQEATFKDDVRVGGARHWYENGQLKYEYTGLPDGRLREWHANGTLKMEVDVKGGKRHGWTTVMDENGEKVEAGEYVADEKVGMWKYWKMKGARRITRLRDHFPQAAPDTDCSQNRFAVDFGPATICIPEFDCLQRTVTKRGDTTFIAQDHWLENRMQIRFEPDPSRIDSVRQRTAFAYMFSVTSRLEGLPLLISPAIPTGQSGAGEFIALDRPEQGHFYPPPFDISALETAMQQHFDPHEAHSLCSPDILIDKLGMSPYQTILEVFGRDDSNNPFRKIVVLQYP